VIEVSNNEINVVYNFFPFHPKGKGIKRQKGRNGKFVINLFIILKYIKV